MVCMFKGSNVFVFVFLFAFFFLFFRLNVIYFSFYKITNDTINWGDKGNVRREWMFVWRFHSKRANNIFSFYVLFSHVIVLNCVLSVSISRFIPFLCVCIFCTWSAIRFGVLFESTIILQANSFQFVNFFSFCFLVFHFLFYS